MNPNRKKLGPVFWQPSDITRLEEINRFVVLAQSGRFCVTDLSERFGFGRSTGHTHLVRTLRQTRLSGPAPAMTIRTAFPVFSFTAPITPRSFLLHQFPIRGTSVPSACPL